MTGKKHRLILNMSKIFLLLIIAILMGFALNIPNAQHTKVFDVDQEAEAERSARSIDQYADQYPEATMLLENKDFFKALCIFRNLADYQDGRAKYHAALQNLRKFSTNSGYHTLGIKSDGTVLAAGKEEILDTLDEEQWGEMFQVLTIHRYGSLGLRHDGTVVSSKNIQDGVDYGDDFSVENWVDIADIQAGYEYVLGLRRDGTVVSSYGEGFSSGEEDPADIGGWKDIVAVSAGIYHSLGLKNNGTVVAFGSNDDGQCEVANWTNLVAVAAGGSFSLGLRTDGSVIAVGDNSNGQCDVEAWRDVVMIGAGGAYSYGIKNDGTVLTTNDDLDVKDWQDIIYVDSGFNRSGGSNMIGLKSNGGLVYTGDNTFGQNDVSNWNLMQ